jgi:hypothetical protein
MGYKNLESVITHFINAITCLPKIEREQAVFSFAGEKRDSLLRLIQGGIELVNLIDGRTIIITAKNCYFIYKYFFCSCNDFYLKNLAKKSSEPCKHILAVLYLDLAT